VLPLEEILVLENSLEHEGTITTRVTGNNVFYKLSKDELLKE